MVKNIKENQTYFAELLLKIVVSVVGFGVIDFLIYQFGILFNWSEQLAMASWDMFDKENAFSAYMTMLSLVFIVTSIVSVISDKSQMIYWVGVMEYKLVNPKYFNLTSLIAALAANVVLATFFVVCYPQIVFVSLVWVIIILFIITSLIMSGFFFRDPTRRKLEKGFLVARLYNGVYSDLEKAYKYYEANSFGNGYAYLRCLWLEENGKVNVKKLLQRHLAVLDKEIESYSQYKEVKRLFDKIEGSGLYDLQNKKLKTITAEPVSNYHELLSYFHEEKIYDAHGNNFSFFDYLENADEKTQEEYALWKRKNSEFLKEKEEHLTLIRKLMEFCKPQSDEFIKVKDELVGITLEHVTEKNIPLIIENLLLLDKARRSGNMIEIFSCMAAENPELYLHVLEIVSKDKEEKQGKFDPAYADITDTMLTKCIINNEYHFSVEYCIRDWMNIALETIDEFTKICFYYQNDLEKRYEIVRSLSECNNILYERLLCINEFIYKICKENNLQMFLMCVRLLHEKPLHNGAKSLLSKMWSFFCGYTNDAKKHYLTYDGKVKNLSWFLPEYLPYYESFLNEQLAKNKISKVEIEKIENLFCEKQFDGRSTDREIQRMTYDAKANEFKCNDSNDFE